MAAIKLLKVTVTIIAIIPGLYPLGIFRNDEHNLLPKLTYINNNKMMIWPNGSPPKDAPTCGFDGEFCLQVINHFLLKNN